jgi:hypothetical protein
MLSLLIAMPPGAFASSHREAPITALDHAADITDFYAFVSYDHPDRVTFIMNVDPFLQPSNGPNYFPFDPSIVYQIKVDNNFNARKTYGSRSASRPTSAPGSSPDSWARATGLRAGKLAGARRPGTPIVPPAITSLTGAGAAG